MPRRGLESGVALAGYAVLSFAYFGVRLLLHGGQTVVGTGADPQLFIWSFAWWPHAILHGQNPIVTHAIWSPDGTNLAWATSVPGLAIPFAPLTLLFGAVASYDVAAVLMPALAAWTAFLLCRRATRSSFLPSLAGGYVFGFSSYMVGGVEGHLHLTSVFLLPLIALVVLRYLEGGLGRRGLALRLGLLIAFQLTLSTEVAFTLTLALVCALVLSFALAPATRPRVRSIVLPLAGSYAFAALLTSPLLYFALTDFHRDAINTGSPTVFTADLLNFVVPTDIIVVGHWTRGITRHFTGNSSEQVAYFGVPALLVLLLFAVRHWRTPSGRFLLTAVAAAAFASFGSWLHVAGRQVVTLPWEHIGYLPVLNNILPVRLFVYVTLAMSAVVALWASSRAVPRWARIALPALVVLSLVPDAGSRVFKTTVHDPPFIADGMYKQCLHHDDNVLVFPFGGKGDSMLWQAETRFWYPMAGGRISPSPPESFTHPPGVADIAIYGDVPDHEVGPLRQYVRLKHVTVVVVDLRNPDPWPSLLRGFAKPKAVGGVLVYRLDGSPPCTSA